MNDATVVAASLLGPTGPNEILDVLQVAAGVGFQILDLLRERRAGRGAEHPPEGKFDPACPQREAVEDLASPAMDEGGQRFAVFFSRAPCGRG